MQLPAKQLTWVTGSSGSNPDLSAIFSRQVKKWRMLSERNAATSAVANETSFRSLAQNVWDRCVVKVGRRLAVGLGEDRIA